MLQKEKKLKLLNEAVPTIFYTLQGERVTVDYNGENYCGTEADEMNRVNQTLRDQEIVAIEAAFVNEQMKLDELKNRCRFCSETRDELIEISSFAIYNINISKLLLSFGLLMAESDFFPNSVCEECFSQVVTLDNFIVKCKSSDQWLWQEIGKLRNITPAVASTIEIVETPELTVPDNSFELVEEEENRASEDILQEQDTISKQSAVSNTQETEEKLEDKRKHKKSKLSESTITDASCNKFTIRTYDCEVCLHAFAGLKTYKTHICDVPEIKCSVCGDNFETAFALKSHRSHLHNANDSRNFCPICKTVITGRLTVFKKHKTKCNKVRIESSRQCEICLKIFTTLHGYHVHMMFHDSKSKNGEDVLATKPKRKAEIICELCGKSYTTIG